MRLRIGEHDFREQPVIHVTRPSGVGDIVRRGFALEDRHVHNLVQPVQSPTA
jgi:hypothetical protein